MITDLEESYLFMCEHSSLEFGFDSLRGPAACSLPRLLIPVKQVSVGD